MDRVRREPKAALHDQSTAGGDLMWAVVLLAALASVAWIFDRALDFF